MPAGRRARATRRSLRHNLLLLRTVQRSQGHLNPTVTWETIEKSEILAGWLEPNVEMINVKTHPAVKVKKPGKCQRLLFVEKVHYYLKWLQLFGLSSVVGNAGWHDGREIQQSHLSKWNKSCVYVAAPSRPCVDDVTTLPANTEIM